MKSVANEYIFRRITWNCTISYVSTVVLPFKHRIALFTKHREVFKANFVTQTIKTSFTNSTRYTHTNNNNSSTSIHSAERLCRDFSPIYLK